MWCHTFRHRHKLFLCDLVTAFSLCIVWKIVPDISLERSVRGGFSAWCCDDGVLWNITYILMWLIKALSLGLQILNIVYICGYMEVYIYKFVYIYTFVYIYSVCVFHGSVSFIFHPYGILELMPKILLCHGSRIFSNFCLLLQWIIKHIKHWQGIITL